MGLTLILLVPVVFNAINLVSEVSIRVASTNDDAYHYLFLQRASDALANGQNILDFWLGQAELGMPVFYYYQHLPALAAVGLNRISLGNVDLLTSMNLIRYALMVGFPLVVFVSMRWMRFPAAAAVLGAACASLIADNYLYGFDYTSYIWRGWGMYTQLWAMNLSFLTLGASYRAIREGRWVWLAGLLLGLLVLTHLVYAYMMAITLLVVLVWGVRRSSVVARLVRLIALGAIAAVISAYMWLPMLSNTAFLNATPYLQPEKYDSYGAPTILGWLASGNLWDAGRLPVLTLLFAVGVTAALLGRLRAATFSLALFVVWLVIYFGRPTLGALVDLFPLHDGLLFHRFIGAVDMAAILLMGMGGATIWYLLVGRGRSLRVVGATAAILLLLTPALQERSTYYGLNTAWQQRSMDAVAGDADAEAVLDRLRTLPAGRVYAGLPATYSNDLAFQDLRFYQLLLFNGIEAFVPPGGSLTLGSDFIWDFDEGDASDYDLYNVRYVVAPAGRTMPAFLSPVLTTSRYVLYEAPTTGYAGYRGILARAAFPSQKSLFPTNLDWERGPLPSQRQLLRYDFPATSIGAGPLSAPDCPSGGSIDFERFHEGLIQVVADCPADSTLIFKTSYHPNWQITVDGQPVEDFMVSPAFIGVSLPAGKHAVTATYVATPMKTPLALLGLLVVVLVLVFHRRVDLRVARIARWNTRNVRRMARRIRRSPTRGERRTA